jgi:hypothetical protein
MFGMKKTLQGMKTSSSYKLFFPQVLCCLQYLTTMPNSVGVKGRGRKRIIQRISGPL